jgi:minor histocompatibility antigen H13
MAGVEDAAALNASALEEDNATNLTGRAAATAGGIIVTYTALFAMALGPIFLGSFRSVSYHLTMKVSTGGGGR